MNSLTRFSSAAARVLPCVTLCFVNRHRERPVVYCPCLVHVHRNKYGIPHTPWTTHSLACEFLGVVCVIDRWSTCHDHFSFRFMCIHMCQVWGNRDQAWGGPQHSRYRAILRKQLPFHPRGRVQGRRELDGVVDSALPCPAVRMHAI